MWIIVLLACFCVTLDCGAQEVTSTDGFTVTETPRPNQEVDWDITGSPVTLSIQDGRSSSVHGPQNYVPDQSLMYSNQWRPILMPIAFNPFRDNNLQRAGTGQSVNHSFVPTFLRRPDSDLNWTLPFESYPEPSQAVNNYPVPLANQFTSLAAPVRPAFFYPQIINDSLRRKHEASGLESEQNSSDVKPALPEPATPNLENDQSRIFPTEHFPIVPFVPQGIPPVNGFSNSRGFYPQLPMYFPPPFPILPDRNDALHPTSSRSSELLHFDREGGSEVIENESPLKIVSVTENPISVVDTHESESIPSEVVQASVPPTASPNIPPPDTLPLPLGGFPFGVLPPPVFPHVLPRPAYPRVLPVNTPLLPGSSDLPRGLTQTGGLETPLQADDRLPLESNPDALPSADPFQPGSDVVTNLPTPEQVIPGEKIGAAKIPYEFGFDMNDGKGTDQHRQEISDGSGVVTGSYGYRDMYGVYRFVKYIADKNGYRAFIKSNEPGVASSGSADVIVMAELPPPRAIEEGAKATEPQAVVVPEETGDLIAEGSEKDII